MVSSIVNANNSDNRLIGWVGRVFANGPGDRGSIPGRVIPKTLKVVLDTSLLNTQQCKVRIKGKVDHSKKSSALCYIVIYMFMQHHNDTIIKTDTRRKTHEGRRSDKDRRSNKRRRKKRRMNHDKDAGRKTQEDFFTKIYTSHFIARVRKGCSRVACERELETEHEH